MSEGQIRLRYEMDVRLMARVMALAGQRLQASVPWTRKIFVFAILSAFFLGALMIFPVIERATGIGLSGAGFLGGVLFTVVGTYIVQRSSVHVLAAAATRSAMRRGAIILTVSQGGIAEQSGIGRIDVVWDAVDEIRALQGATVIRFGAMCFAVPDSALPEDLPPDDFRAQLSAWQAASETFG
jgi:hypothetical protein